MVLVNRGSRNSVLRKYVRAPDTQHSYPELRGGGAISARTNVRKASDIESAAISPIQNVGLLS